MVFNLVLFSLGIAFVPELKPLYFLGFILLNMAFIFAFSRKEGLFKSWFVLPLYGLSYVLLATLNVLPLNPYLIISMLIGMHLNIKLSTFIFKGQKNNQKMEVWDYAIVDDFDKGLSFHKYGIPLGQREGDTRLIDDELKLMRTYNKELNLKHKITDKNFGEIGNLHFYVPKSLSLVVYQSIMHYCENESTNPVSPIHIKVRDYTDQNFNINRGDYMLEFKIDQSILIDRPSHSAKTLVDAITEIQNVCLHKKISIYGIEHGVSSENKKYYIIRIKYKRVEQVDPKVVAALTHATELLNMPTHNSSRTEYETMN